MLLREAVCRKCGQTFTPESDSDLIHQTKVGDDTHPDEECGGQGDLVVGSALI